MNIIPQFDNNALNSAPGWYQPAVNQVCQTFNSEFTNDITVNISFGWGEAGGSDFSGGQGVSKSVFSVDYLNYDQL